MKELPQIFAFYSFKGGVGRSMAVVNLAYALAAKGRHVLVLDMDLEAPGLSGFLHREEEITGFARLDMVNLVSWASSASLPLDPLSFPSLCDYVVSIPPGKVNPIPRAWNDIGRLDIIPVEENRVYYDRLTSLGMGNFSQDDLVRTGSVVRAWLSSLRFPIEVPDYYGPDFDRTSTYDYVLVDSRTGITETGGLCIGPLSDQLVVLSALNDQNVKGTRNFLMEVGVLENSDQPDSNSVRKPFLIVASLVPIGEIKIKERRLEEFEKALGKVEVKLSYHPQLALEETIFTRDYPDEYLTREYDVLLQQVLRMADDGYDEVIAEKMPKLSRSSPEFREALRRLTRLASTDSAALLLHYLLSTVNTTRISEGIDYILWDRACRVLSTLGAPSRLDILEAWAVLLSDWSQSSKNPELAALRLQAARSHCEQVLQSKEASSEQKARALLIRGMTYSYTHERENAVADYTNVINSPDVPDEPRALALHYRGVEHGERFELERAIDDYTSVIKMADALARERFRAPFYNTVAYSQTFAVIQMTDAVARERLHAPLYNTGAYSRAFKVANLTDFTALIGTLNPLANVKSRSLVNRGEVYRKKGEREKAIADNTSVIEMPEASVDVKAIALINRGSLHSIEKEWEKAIADYTAVIQMPDTSVEYKAQAQVNRGTTHRQRGELERAMTDYSAVIEIVDAPSQQKALALINRGGMYSMQGDTKKALADCNSVLQLSGTTADQQAQAMVNRGGAYFKELEFDKAIADYSVVLQMPEASTEQRIKALINRGQTFIQQKDLEKAITDYTEVIHMADAPAVWKSEALLSRGWTYYLLGHLQDAIDDEQQSIALSPKNSLAHANLALALLVQGSYTDALAAYNTAFALANSDELVEMSADLEAIKRLGRVLGAEEVLARLEARRQVLSQSYPDNSSGFIPQEPEGNT